MRWTTVLAAACGGCVSVAGAQTIDWAAAASGSWNNAANWNPVNVPDTAGENARFNVNGTYTVTVNGTFSIGSLFQNITNVTIDIPGSQNLLINGPTMNNRGLIVINPSNAGVETRLRFDGDTNITGNGITRLGGFQNRSIVESNVGVTTVTNGANHTFDGLGQFRSVLTNNGTVEANVNGNALSLQINNKTNNGLFLASTGGTLSIEGIGITQSASGLIQADGGTVNFSGSSSVTGGTVEGVAPSLVQVFNTSTWTDVTAEGSIDVVGGNNLFVAGLGLTVNGTLRINPSNAAAETRLRFNDAGVLGGTGEVVMGGFTNRAILESVDASSIATTSGTMEIRGLGQIRAGLVNNGVVSADVNGNVLSLQNEPKTNNSLMRATNNGFLDFSAAITQAPLGEIRADAGTVRFANAASLTSGVVTSINGGLVQVFNSIPFNAVRNDAVLDVVASANLLVTNSLVNNGIITVNPTNAASETRLRFDDTSSLNGTGEVVMAGFENRSIFETLPGQVVTIGANQEIRGLGRIAANLVNNGTITADVSGNVLRLHVENKVNNNDMFVRDDAHMNLNGVTLTQGAGAFVEVDGGFFNMESGTVDGGQIRTLGDGLFRTTSGSNTWRNVTFSGDGDVNGGTNLFITGSGLVNNGLIEVNPADAAVETRLNFNESGTLSGTGEVRLTGFNNRALVETPGGIILTHAAPHVIAGRGEIRAQIINNSTIRANSPASSLFLNSNAKTNNSVMEAVTGGDLIISNITVTQGAGGIIRNDASSLRIRNATIDGGAITTLNGGFANVESGASTFTGLTLTGEARIQGGQNLLLGGPVTSNALIDVNPSNASVETRLRFDATTTLGGTGEVRLSGGFNRAILEASAGITGTLGAGQKLSGVGQARGNLNLNGTIAPGFSAGTIDVTGGTIDLSDTTTYDFEVGGTSTALHDRCTGNATWNVDGTVTVTHINGFVPAEGQRFVIIQGSAVHGLFDELIAPDLGGVEWKLTYFPNKVELQVRCKADLSGSADPNNPNYGIPDGTRDASDFFYYLDLFVAGDSRADLTGSADPNDPAYGIKDGIIDASDFFFFLDIFTGVCS